MENRNCVLLVYQQEDVRDRIRRTLKINGFDLVPILFKSNTENITSVDGRRIQLVLVENLEDDAKCIDIVESLKADSYLRALPMFLLTGYDLPFDRMKWHNIGVIGFITEPYESDTMAGQIRAILQQLEMSGEKYSLTYSMNVFDLGSGFRQRLKEKKKIAFSLIKFQNLDIFCRKYGYDVLGDFILEFTAIMRMAINEKGNSDDIVAQIGGDRFILLTSIEKVDALCSYVIKVFDRDFAQLHYNIEDRKKGYLACQDRKGKVLHYPFIKLNIGTVTNENRDITSSLQVLCIAEELLNKAKDSKESCYFKDRRVD